MGWTYLLAGYLCTWGVIPHLLLARKRPIATLAWLWFILLVPYIGAIAYFMLGADRVQRRRLRRIAKPLFQTRSAARATEDRRNQLESPMRELVRSLSVINDLPLSTADDIRLLIQAESFYPALIRRIEEAEHHIHIEFFIWRDDEGGMPILRALEAACARGVEVRVLIDQMGSWGLRRSVFDRLCALGGEFAWFYSVPFGAHLRFLNLRNHRKLQIIDGKHAFVGGMNVGREYLGLDPKQGSWRDAGLEVSGEVVSFLQEIFATDWFFATNRKLLNDCYFPRCGQGEGALCQILAGGPDAARTPMPNSIAAILTSARKRLWIATGYFVPDSVMLTALQIAGARGADVRILISEKSDHPYLVQVGRSYYEDLLRYGVRIYEYSRGINHTKAILVDDDWFAVGSTNCDVRSMRLNFEISLLVESARDAVLLEKMMCEDFDASLEITREQVRAKPTRQRLLEAALRPLAPML